jgi:hypothetical protein
MRLDDRRGIERVYVVVANRRVPEIERLIDEGDPEVSDSWLIVLRSRDARHAGRGSTPRPTSVRTVRWHWR